MKHIPILLLLIPLLAHAHKVIGISDGDTMTLLVDRNPLRIRLANIDAPEITQAFGQKSKRSLSDLCWGKDAQYDARTVDQYGRTVAVVRCAGVEVNRAQVRRGMAWTYPHYNQDAGLPMLERGSRAQRVGLWSDAHPVPPWVYRHAVPLQPPSATDACLTGPRGGRYRIIDGHKRYGC
ncbi:MAG: thermonuclease family protein [Herbaspirillum sp.]|jgi:micrococcal nuclease|nr:thermonuclease family protein [Herbaspirillum sp.]